MVLQVVANMIEAMRNDQREQPIYPVWACNCGKEGAVLVEGVETMKERDLRLTPLREAVGEGILTCWIHDIRFD